MLKRLAFVSVLVLGLALYLRSGPKLGKVVTLNEGSVQGIVASSRDGREFYSWHHIPYAKPPVGNLRFADPLPAERWEGVRQGLSPGPQCAQISMPFLGKGMSGEEDCLHLSVNAPKKMYDEKESSREQLPVLVCIHGGAYIGGSGNHFDGSYLMDEDVVMVSINYRLDILGFLTTGDKVVRGNMGLKDQTLALKWVNKNIHHFGGDPSRVTIYGTSAGGASVHQQMLSQRSKGLFKKAFSQSGAASNVWGFLPLKRALEKTKEIGDALNCPTADSQQLVDCLRKLDVKDLMKPLEDIWDTYFLLYPHTDQDSFGPIVEAVKDDQAFLTEHPVKVVAEGRSHAVPWMAGFCTHEGLSGSIGYIKFPENITKFESEPETHIQKLFSIENEKSKAEISKKIWEFYSPASERSKLTFEDKWSKYTDLFGDAFFNFDIYEAVQYQRKLSPVYYYLHNKTDGPTIFTDLTLEFEGKYHVVIELGMYLIKSYVKGVLGYESRNYGVSHGADGAYYISFGGLLQMAPGSKNYQYSKDLVRLLVDFMRDDTKMEFRGVPFPPTPSSGPLKALEFTNEGAQLIPSPFEERLGFLHSLGIRYSPKN